MGASFKSRHNHYRRRTAHRPFGSFRQESGQPLEEVDFLRTWLQKRNEERRALAVGSSQDLNWGDSDPSVLNALLSKRQIDSLS